jgi:hypothetical protein
MPDLWDTTPDPSITATTITDHLRQIRLAIDPRTGWERP